MYSIDEEKNLAEESESQTIPEPNSLEMEKTLSLPNHNGFNNTLAYRYNSPTSLFILLSHNLRSTNTNTGHNTDTKTWNDNNLKNDIIQCNYMCRGRTPTSL